MKKVISEHQVGVRKSDFSMRPVFNQLIRLEWSSRRPAYVEWLVVVGLCGGTAEYDRSFHTKKDAKEFFDTVNGWGPSVRGAK